MRYLLVLTLALLTLSVSPAQEEKDVRKKGEAEIKVVTLDRKTPVTYEKDVEPILVNKCAFCHSGNVKEGKFDLTSYDTMMRGGKRGPAIIPGKSAESFLHNISAKKVRPYMPPRSEEPLTPEELAVVKLWIDQGAKPPTGSRPVIKPVLKAPATNPVLGVAVSPDKSAVVASRGNKLHVYDAGSGMIVRSLVDKAVVGSDKKPLDAAHLSLVESVVYSGDGKYVASGSFQEVKIWDAKTGELKRTIDGFSERVPALAFSNDGKLLACGGGAPTQEGELKVFEVATGKLAVEIKANVHSDTVFSVAFAADDKTLVSGGADKFVKTFELPSGKFVKSFEGHTHHVMGVGITADGKFIASGGADNVVKIWDVAKGEQVRTINAHGKQISALVFVGKSNKFVTCAGDQQARVWNVTGGNDRNFNTGSDYLLCVAASPDGSVIATGGQEGVVRVYNGNSGALIKTLAPPGVEKAETKKESKKEMKK